jgi:hypothetical protein
MLKKLFLTTVLLTLAFYVFSLDYEWGVKYSLGMSQIHGKDLNYTSHYDFESTLNDTLTFDAGYVEIRSNRQKHGLSQNAGVFFSFPLTSAETTLLFQPELLWQRYSYSYWFKDRYLDTNNFMIGGSLWDKVNGYAYSTIDYITVPMLFKMQQNNPPEVAANHAIVSMYGYFGPSVSFLIDNKVTLQKDVKTFDNNVQTLVEDSQNDADLTQYYTYDKTPSSAEELASMKYDLVFGFGWNLRDALKIGWGKDEWVLDFRFNLNINPIGDSVTNKNFKLYNGLVSLGYKL